MKLYSIEDLNGTMQLRIEFSHTSTFSFIFLEDAKTLSSLDFCMDCENKEVIKLSDLVKGDATPGKKLCLVDCTNPVNSDLNILSSMGDEQSRQIENPTAFLFVFLRKDQRDLAQNIRQWDLRNGSSFFDLDTDLIATANYFKLKDSIELENSIKSSTKKMKI